MAGQLVHELRRLLDSTFTRIVGLAVARTRSATSVRVIVACPSVSAGQRISCFTLPDVAEATQQVRSFLFLSDEESEDCVWHNGAALSRHARVQLHLMPANTSREALEAQAIHSAEAAVACAAESNAAVDCERFTDGTEVENSLQGRYVVRSAPFGKLTVRHIRSGYDLNAQLELYNSNPLINRRGKDIEPMPAVLPACFHSLYAKSLPTVPEIRLVNTEQHLAEVSAILSASERIGMSLVACQPSDSAHHGQVSLIQLHAASVEPVFCVDVISLGLEIVKRHLGQLLESRSPQKLVYDLMLTQPLEAQLQLNLDGVVDVQLAVAAHRWRSCGDTVRWSLKRAVETFLSYVPQHSFEDVEATIASDSCAWTDRPLSQLWLAYAANDVTNLHALFGALAKHSRAACSLSQRYLEHYHLSADQSIRICVIDDQLQARMTAVKLIKMVIDGYTPPLNLKALQAVWEDDRVKVAGSEAAHLSECVSWVNLDPKRTIVFLDRMLDHPGKCIDGLDLIPELSAQGALVVMRSANASQEDSALYTKRGAFGVVSKVLHGTDEPQVVTDAKGCIARQGIYLPPRLSISSLNATSAALETLNESWLAAEAGEAGHCAVCGHQGHDEQHCRRLQVCTLCGKQGHAAERCFLIPCTICGLTGHLSEHCRWAVTPAQFPKLTKPVANVTEGCAGSTQALQELLAAGDSIPELKRSVSFWLGPGSSKRLEAVAAVVEDDEFVAAVVDEEVSLVVPSLSGFTQTDAAAVSAPHQADTSQTNPAETLSELTTAADAAAAHAVASEERIEIEKPHEIGVSFSPEPTGPKRVAIAGLHSTEVLVVEVNASTLPELARLLCEQTPRKFGFSLPSDAVLLAGMSQNNESCMMKGLIDIRATEVVERLVSSSEELREKLQRALVDADRDRIVKAMVDRYSSSMHLGVCSLLKLVTRDSAARANCFWDSAWHNGLDDCQFNKQLKSIVMDAYGSWKVGAILEGGVVRAEDVGGCEDTLFQALRINLMQQRLFMRLQPFETPVSYSALRIASTCGKSKSKKKSKRQKAAQRSVTMLSIRCNSYSSSLRSKSDVIIVLEEGRRVPAEVVFARPPVFTIRVFAGIESTKDIHAIFHSSSDPTEGWTLDCLAGGCCRQEEDHWQSGALVAELYRSAYGDSNTGNRSSSGKANGSVQVWMHPSRRASQKETERLNASRTAALAKALAAVADAAAAQRRQAVSCWFDYHLSRKSVHEGVRLALSGLNEDQHGTVIDALEHYHHRAMLVDAPPGTGKTWTLAALAISKVLHRPTPAPRRMQASTGFDILELFTRTTETTSIPTAHCSMLSSTCRELWHCMLDLRGGERPTRSTSVLLLAKTNNAVKALLEKLLAKVKDLGTAWPWHDCKGHGIFCLVSGEYFHHWHEAGYSDLLDCCYVTTKQNHQNQVQLPNIDPLVISDPLVLSDDEESDSDVDSEEEDLSLNSTPSPTDKHSDGEFGENTLLDEYTLRSQRKGQPPIILTTSSMWSLYRGLQQRPEFTSLDVQSVLVDEASQLFGGKLAEIMIETAADAHVLVGDSKQLPPHNADTVEEHTCTAVLNSLDLVRQHPDTRHHQLNTSYRLFPNLCALISRVFYSGRLESLPRCCAPWAGKWPGMNDLLWVDVPEGAEESPCDSTSKQNISEARTVAKLASDFLLDDQCSVAILTPYDAQRQLIQKYCLEVPGVAARYNKLVDGTQTLQPFVFNIDAFQGREADIVFVSLVRTETIGRFLGKHSGQQRTNVLLSRAKHSMCVVGKFEVFASEHSKCPWWKSLCCQPGFHRINKGEHPTFSTTTQGLAGTVTAGEGEVRRDGLSVTLEHEVAGTIDDLMQHCETPNQHEKKAALVKIQEICRDHSNEVFLRRWDLDKATRNALQKYKYAKFTQMFQEFRSIKVMLQDFVD